MKLNVKGRSFVNIFYYVVLFLFVILSACTPANPQFGFDFSSERISSSLTLITNAEALNLANNATVILSGNCSKNSTLHLLTPVESVLNCADGSYLKSLDLSSLSDGTIIINVEEKNAFGDVTSLQKSLVKDMILPSISIVQPANLASGISTINLSGSCSEEGIDVIILESSTKTNQSVKCQNLHWDVLYNLGTDLGINNFTFQVKQTDNGLNSVSASTSVVSRVVVGDYSISGVSTTFGGSYLSTLKGSFNNFWVRWTSAVNVVKYDLSIYQYNSGTQAYDDLKCSKTNISGTSADAQVTSCVLTAGTGYQIKMSAANNIGQQVVRTMNFVTKALPKFRLDSKKLFIQSGFDTVSGTEILYSDLIDSYDPNDGPFTINITGLSADIYSNFTNNNVSQKIIISPTNKLSGIFSYNIQITDAFNNVSVADVGNFILAMPYSWAGLIDNDFNKPGNWCGSVSLHSGCLGSALGPSFYSKIMIDNLCEYPVANPATSHCSPALSANTNVHSFYIKAKSFDQNGKSLTIGDTSSPGTGEFLRTTSFFKQTGGQFNSSSISSSGNLFVLNYFYQLGGIFYAPFRSDFTLSSMHTSWNSAMAVITDKNNFYHNYGRVIFIDPQGSNSGSIYFDAPIGTELFNFKFSTDGSTWMFRSDNLIVNGDLELSGTLYAGVYYSKIDAFSATHKITLRGNLKCTGVNKGGSLPIYIDSSVNKTYSVTHTDCKFPPVYLANSGSIFQEDVNSVYDAKFERLVISSGNTFKAPSSRKIVINTEFSDNASYAFNNAGGFDPNGGTIEFQNMGDGTKEFNIYSSTALNKVNFVNNSLSGHFYKMFNDLSVTVLTFSGSHSINLRAYGRTVSADDMIINKGLTFDSNVLDRLFLTGNGSNAISVNTSDRINVLKFAIGRSSTFSGSSNLFDLSGANLDIGGFIFSVDSGATLNFNNLVKTSGNLSGSGTFKMGML